MLHTRGSFGLTMEARGLLSETGQKSFDDHLISDVYSPRPINRAHSTHAQHTKKFVFSAKYLPDHALGDKLPAIRTPAVFANDKVVTVTAVHFCEVGLGFNLMIFGSSM